MKIHENALCNRLLSVRILLDTNELSHARIAHAILLVWSIDVLVNLYKYMKMYENALSL